MTMQPFNFSSRVDLVKTSLRILISYIHSVKNLMWVYNCDKLGTQISKTNITPQGGFFSIFKAHFESYLIADRSSCEKKITGYLPAFSLYLYILLSGSEIDLNSRSPMVRVILIGIGIYRSLHIHTKYKSFACRSDTEVHYGYSEYQFKRATKYIILLIWRDAVLRKNLILIFCVISF